MKTIFSICLVLLVSFSCKSKKNAAKSTETIQKTQPMELKATLGKIPEHSDALTIESATIKGNILTIEVTYGGGCQEHEFQLIGSEMIAKSMPPIRSIKLIHKANQDNCRAIVSQTLKFDIRKLAYKQEAGSEIYLNLDAYNERLVYVFE
jgi:hypothetical protein